jgi:hypothetical protein
MAPTQQRPEEHQEDKRQIGGELIVPVLALAFTLYYISTVINSPWSAQLNAFLVGSVLIVLVLAFFAYAAREVLSGQATLGASNLLAPYEFLPKRAGFIFLTLAYLVVMQWLGLTLTTFLFMAASMLLLGGGRRPVVCLAAATVMAATALVVFVILFQKRFPEGPVEVLVEALTRGG